MATVKEIFSYLDSVAPFSLQMDFDNAGFLVGRENTKVKRVMIALDITEAVIDEAVETDCQLIVSHHPIIFHPARSITDTTPTGRCLLKLIEHHIAAICAHTNLDVAEGGVNDALAQTLGLNHIELLQEGGQDRYGRPYGLGRVGTLSEPLSATEFAAFAKQQLHVDGLRLEDAGRSVTRVAVGGGACGDCLSDIIRMGCDTFVTADVKYNTFLDAKALGINLIDAGHFATENVICPVLEKLLRTEFSDLTVYISKNHKEVFSSI